MSKTWHWSFYRLSLHCLPITKRIDHKVASLCYASLNDLAPQYLTDVAEDYIPNHVLRSSSQRFFPLSSSWRQVVRAPSPSRVPLRGILFPSPLLRVLAFLPSSPIRKLIISSSYFLNFTFLRSLAVHCLPFLFLFITYLPLTSLLFGLFLYPVTWILLPA